MVECPHEKCEYDSTEHGIKLHHKRTHGTSLVKSEFTCDCCEEVFKEYDCNREGHQNVFCSPECREEFKRENSDVDWWHTCDLCDDEFRRHPSVIGDTQFCSQECHHNYIRENPDWLTWYKGGQKEVECSWCEKSIKRRPYQAEKEKEYFCSRECHGAWMSENWSGSASPNWKGGYKPYYGPSWRTQRQKALDRDNFQCQDCGMGQDKHHEKHGKELEVHHKKPLRTFDDTSKANRLENLTTLCVKCHSKREYKMNDKILA